MSVGGKVIESKIFAESVYINTKDDGAECAIFVDRDKNSAVNIHTGDCRFSGNASMSFFIPTRINVALPSIT